MLDGPVYCIIQQNQLTIIIIPSHGGNSLFLQHGGSASPSGGPLLEGVLVPLVFGCHHDITRCLVYIHFNEMDVHIKSPDGEICLSYKISNKKRAIAPGL